MKDKLIILYPVIIIILMATSALGGILGYLVFPGVALIVYYVSFFKLGSRGNKVLIVGLCWLVTFITWQLVFKNEVNLARVAIYSILILVAFEAWYVNSFTIPNRWGIMNLVVFYLAIEYITLEWLPFDTAHWILGAPIIDDERIYTWTLYTGVQGITLWIWISALILAKGFDGKLRILPLAGGVLLIVLPILLVPEVSDNSAYYAQGEWIGRTCIWISILILAYAFVKRKVDRNKK